MGNVLGPCATEAREVCDRCKWLDRCLHARKWTNSLHLERETRYLERAWGG